MMADPSLFAHIIEGIAVTTCTVIVTWMMKGIKWMMQRLLQRMEGILENVATKQFVTQEIHRSEERLAGMFLQTSQANTLMKSLEARIAAVEAIMRNQPEG